MRPFVKWNLVVLALAAGLACATGAYADTLSWSITGTGIPGEGVVGSGTMTATNEGGGVELVTGMWGTVNITYNGVTTGGAITGFTPYWGTPAPGNYATDPTGLYYYNDLVYPSTTPQLDLWGVVFDVNGFSNPLNLCGGAGCTTGDASYPYVLWDVNVAGPSNSLGYGSNYNAYQVAFSSTVTSAPEPSAMGLLGLGLLGLVLALGRERLRAS